MYINYPVCFVSYIHVDCTEHFVKTLTYWSGDHQLFNKYVSILTVSLHLILHIANTHSCTLLNGHVITLTYVCHKITHQVRDN